MKVKLKLTFFEHLEPGHFASMLIQAGVFLGRVSDPSKGIYGAGAHSDYGLITLLATDDVLGLQVRAHCKTDLLCEE